MGGKENAAKEDQDSVAKSTASDGKDSMLFICFTTCNEVCFRDSRVRMWVYMKTLYISNINIV